MEGYRAGYRLLREQLDMKRNKNLARTGYGQDTIGVMVQLPGHAARGVRYSLARASLINGCSSLAMSRLPRLHIDT